MSAPLPRPRPEHRDLARRVVQAGLPYDASDETPHLARVLADVLENLDEYDRLALVLAHEAREDFQRELGERLLAQWLAEHDSA